MPENDPLDITFDPYEPTTWEAAWPVEAWVQDFYGLTPDVVAEFGLSDPGDWSNWEGLDTEATTSLLGEITVDTGNQMWVGNEAFGTPEDTDRLVAAARIVDDPLAAPEEVDAAQRELSSVLGGLTGAEYTSAGAEYTSGETLLAANFDDLSSALDNMTRNVMVDPANGNAYDSAGQQIGPPGFGTRLVESIREAEDSVRDPTMRTEYKGSALGRLWNTVKEGWGSIGAEFRYPMAAMMVGALGLGIAGAVTGGADEITLPPPPGPSPAQQTGMQTFQNVLNNPPPATTLPGGAGTTLPGGAETDTVPGGAGPPAGTLPPAFTATGAQNLEGIFRAGLSGQNILANLAAYQAAREAGIISQMAPYEDALRALAVARIPLFLTPPGSLATTIAGLGTPGAGTTVPGGAGTDTLPGGAGTDPATSVSPTSRDLMAYWVQQALDPSGVPNLPRLVDPIRTEIASELARLFGDETASPLLARIERDETLALENRLAAQLGPGYATSTPGIDALQRLRESQALRREANRQQELGTLLPQEFARRQAEYGLPLNAVSTLGAGQIAQGQFEAGERASGLAESLALLNMGRIPTGTLAATLGQYVPISPLLGIDATNQANAQQYAQNTQAAIANFNAQNQSDAAILNAIAGLTGIAASAFRPTTTFAWPTTPAPATGGR